MRFEFHPEALAEYREAALHYAQSQPDLDLRFIECVEQAIRKITEAPTRWRIFEQGIRRCLVRVFPYAILYSIESDYVLIVAVMHCKREPGYWRSRITQ